jgi:hypothetical protein
MTLESSVPKWFEYKGERFYLEPEDLEWDVQNEDPNLIV